MQNRVFLVAPIGASSRGASAQRRKRTPVSLSKFVKLLLISTLLGASAVGAPKNVSAANLLRGSQNLNVLKLRNSEYRKLLHPFMNEYGKTHIDEDIARIYERGARKMSSRVSSILANTTITWNGPNGDVNTTINRSTNALINANKTIIRTAGRVLEEYALIRHDTHLCRSANVFVNDPLVNKTKLFFMDNKIGFLLNADKAMKNGRVHGVYLTDVYSPSDPLRTRCGVKPQYAERRTTWASAVQATKVWHPGNESQGVCEVTMDITDDQVLGLVVNPNNPPSWGEIETIVKGSIRLAAAYGKGPSKLTSIYIVDSATNTLKKIKSKAQYTATFTRGKKSDLHFNLRVQMSKTKEKLLRTFRLRPGMRTADIDEKYSNAWWYYAKQFRRMPKAERNAYNIARSLSAEKVGRYTGTYR
jgi:hypothetical protein